jgi:hypothetical protein
MLSASSDFDEKLVMILVVSRFSLASTPPCRERTKDRFSASLRMRLRDREMGTAMGRTRAGV